MILAPGATIGILGSGQLGRMLAMAALKLGLRCHIYAPESDAPAYDAASEGTVAAFDDEAALARFADAVDVVTYEFENVPIGSVEFLEKRKPVRPGARALAATQDRLAEKTFLRDLGLATAPFRAVPNAAALAPALAEIGRPAVLKTLRLGYDGKGQAMIREGSDLPTLHRGLGGGPMILEGFVAFDCEASVVIARSLEGAMVAYDLCENEHDRHILARTHVPARVPPGVEAAAKALAAKAIGALDYVGVLAVELFVARDAAGGARLLVNELAPRVHNSGHWTIEGAQTSQFEQHIRAIAGWPLGPTTPLAFVEMENLLGPEAHDWLALAGEAEARVWLYGKGDARPGRKMGHVNRLRPLKG
jgi:5-(carboxyamino)imidazole ribonucleotide synthase